MLNTGNHPQHQSDSKGKRCPACGKDIGIWVVVNAPFPPWVNCPHCKTRLRYSPFPWALCITGFVIFIGVSAYAFMTSYTEKPLAGGGWEWSFYPPIFSLIGLAVAIDVVLACYLRSKCSLIFASKSHCDT